jgi:hypothetical protein
VPFAAATGGIVRVIGPQGIWKPKGFQLPLSITTSPDSPYSDAFSTDGHAELLDAAHIVPDSDAMGEPRVSKGLSLCKLHHAAFDSFLVSVTPDYSIQVRPSVPEEEDGPMLEHGLKGAAWVRDSAADACRRAPGSRLACAAPGAFSGVGVRAGAEG